MRCSIPAILVAALGWAGASCTEVAMDGAVSGSGGTSSGPSFGTGTVGSNCRPTLDGCQWRISECSSNPGCARWYECLLSCEVGNISACFNKCDVDYGKDDERERVKACLRSAEGCAPLNDSAGAKNTPAAKGDAGAGEVWDGFGGAAGAHAMPVGGYQSCHACLYEGCMSEFCPIEQREACGVYKEVYLACSSDGEEQTVSAHEMQACLLNKEESGSSAIKAAHELFASSGTLECITSTCASLCLPEAQRPCQSCLLTNCPDELKAYSRSAIAQDAQWCQTACAEQADTQKCLEEKCAQYLDGNPILELLVACRYASCIDACAGMP